MTVEELIEQLERDLPKLRREAEDAQLRYERGRRAQQVFEKLAKRAAKREAAAG